MLILPVEDNDYLYFYLLPFCSVVNKRFDDPIEMVSFLPTLFRLRFWLYRINILL